MTLTLLVIAQDLMHSSLRNYSFYLSESLLFSTFWLLFIPLTLIFKRRKSKKFRLLLPVVFSVVHLGVFSFLVFSISSAFFNDAFEFSRTFVNATSEYGIVCMVIYGLCTFLFASKRKSFKEITSHKVSPKIKVSHHNQMVILDCKDILYVKAEKPYIALVTKNRSYLHQGSLKKFLEVKATRNFIQIHKSLIVNTDHIVSYTSRKNGDYDILMVNNDLVRASRSYNTNFKPLFDSIGST